MTVDRDSIIVTLFANAEHDFARIGMYMTLRETLGHGYSLGEELELASLHDGVDWTEQARLLLEADREGVS